MSSITQIKSRAASVRRFTQFKSYTDSGAVNQVCRDLLDRGAGEAVNLQIGICQIKGPGQVAEDAHATWSQYFVCPEGRGTLFIEGVGQPFEAGMIVEIPKNTRHYARCATGESLTYFFINIHD